MDFHEIFNVQEAWPGDSRICVTSDSRIYVTSNSRIYVTIDSRIYVTSDSRNCVTGCIARNVCVRTQTLRQCAHTYCYPYVCAHYSNRLCTAICMCVLFATLVNC